MTSEPRYGRAIVLLVLGLAGGLLLAQLLPRVPGPAHHPEQVDGGWSDLPPLVAPGEVAPSLASARSPGQFARRVDVYQLAAGSDGPALAELLDQLASRSNSPARRFAAQVLLSRYLELDPQAALGRARQLELPPQSLAGFYGLWAEADAEAALAALGSEPDLAAVQAVGDALIELLGGDSGAINRVADALPAGVDRTSFQARAYAAIARRDPDYAWLQSQDIPAAQLRLRAQQQILEAVMERDPVAALQRAGKSTIAPCARPPAGRCWRAGWQGIRGRCWNTWPEWVPTCPRTGVLSPRRSMRSWRLRNRCYCWKP